MEEKIMKKKLMTFVLMLSLVVTCIAISPAKDVQAAAKWKKAYEKKVKSYDSAHDVVKYATVKMSGMKNPVLLVSYTDSHKKSAKVIMFKYANGKAKTIWKSRELWSSRGTFYKKGKKILLKCGYGDSKYYYSFNVEKGKVKADDYGTIWDGYSTIYIKNGNSCSKKEFDKMTKGGKKIKMK